MAISDALAWRLNNGGTAADLYADINTFLASSPDAATTQSLMAQYGISGEDVANATGGKSGGLLGGNIMAGASWNSLNTTLPEQLTAATGQATTNVAVGGATTADTLNQLNTFLAGGGQFDPNATVYLQTGGVDFLQGVDKGTIKDNINQIVKTLGAQGVDVVLTGSPYAKSIDDVINNNFDPKVDQIFTDIAKENKNVALVGVQGEILQNKKLLVDALHTNAEGTAIYNQAVIDSLSQFKNEVPSSTPQAIAQVQQTNTVATTPPIITQAAASPAVAQTLARVIPTARGTVIEGDNIEAQIAGVPQVVYETRVDPNNKANWQTVNPKTGEVIDSGTFAGGGDQGLLRAAAPVIALAAGTVGLPFITNLLGTATGLTGSALSGATGAAIGAGTQAVTGGNAQDIARAALLGGGGAFLGSELNNYLKYQDVPVDFTNMTQDQINDALDVNFRNDLARAGLSDAQIKSYIANPASVYDTTQAVTTPTTTPVAVSTPVTDGGAVNITAPTTPSLSNVLSTIASTTPTVNVAAPKAPQQVDQAVLDLVNSQIATNVKTPTNLANVQITGDRPATTQEIVNAITATIPNVTAAQAQTLAEQVITSGKQVTTQELANAVTATIPALTQTTPVATQTITGQKPITTQEIVNAITASIPAVTTPTTTPIATQTITGQKPATVEEIVNAITATIPTVTPTQAQTVAQQVITGDRPVTTQEVINAITAAIPSVIAPTTEPRVTITAEKPSSIVDAVTAATIPLIQPSTPLTVPQVTAQKPVDPLRVAQLGLTAAGLLGAGSALSGGSTATQYPVVPVPESWTTPITGTTGTTPYPQLPAINFGDRNLLRGTQWEKFLDPNYGKVPSPVKYSQPSNLSYNDLMGILGSKQGMPAKSSLSINDIISGIQNQYGQTPASTVG
jgi:hypothetical protein